MTTKHKDPHHPLEVEKPDLLDEIQESSYFQWLLDKRGLLPYVFLAVVIIIIGAFRFTSSSRVAEESNYLLAENYFSQLDRSLQMGTESANSAADLEKLEQVISTYPELQTKYDALVAQTFITMEKPKEAKPFADRTLQRTEKDGMKYYRAFSESTLRISEGAYSKALEEAKLLKTKMLESSKPNFPANLFAYNLFRIAVLEGKAGSSTGEIEAWKEWKNYAAGTEQTETKQAIASIISVLKEGEFTLNQYINIRENLLGKK